MARITKEQLLIELKELGIEKGDTLFVAADLMKVGYFNTSSDQTLKDWVEIFDELLGKEGTIIVPTYSPVFLRFFQKYNFVFSKESSSNSGSLAKAYLNFAHEAIRGNHPTNSCISKGFYSKEIAAVDGPKFLKYAPYKKVIELKGKNLMLGTVDKRNCPFTYHHVQETLGHTKSHPYSNLLETTYIDKNGKKKKYILKEIGGCTAGVHKTWGYHLAENAVKFSKVGRSLSALVDAEKSAAIIKDIMVKDPHLIKCDDKQCISCYGRYRYNGFGAILFYLRMMPNLMLKFYNKLRN